MFVWAPLPEQYRPLGSLEFAKLLMDKALVAVSPGIGFGPMGEGHVRFGLVENEHRIRQAAKSIQRFLKTGLTSPPRSEEHTSELQSHLNIVCRLLL